MNGLIKERKMKLRKMILNEVEKRHPASDKPLTKILEKIDKQDNSKFEQTNGKSTNENNQD